MKPLAFVLLVLVGSLILTNLPAPSYADPKLDALLRIATQARDNISIQLSQLPTVPGEINQLYKQGSEETDALAQSVSQEDEGSSKGHFLSAMRIFKAINDKISSPTPTTSEQPSQIDTLRLKGVINRMQNLGDKLKTISTNNNVEIDFTKFDKLMQDARQNLDAGNVDQVNNDLENTNQFLLDAHHLLVDAAKKKTSDRARDFTNKQIERLSQVKAASPLQNATQPFAPIAKPIPETTNTSQIENMHDMIAKLKQLVSEGKIDEALKLIKLIEASQRQETRSQVSTTETPNATQPANTSNVNAPEIKNPVNNSTSIPNQVNSTAIPKQDSSRQTDTTNSANATQKANVANDNLSHNDHEKRMHEKRKEIDSENKDRIKIRTSNSEN